MRRRKREVQVFSMSMLDVLASALGAFLLLFLLSEQAKQDARAEARKKDETIEQLQARIRSAEEEVKAAIAQAAAAVAAAASARERVRQLERKRQLEALAKGMAIGMCEVDTDQVRVTIRDKGDEDGDAVRLEANGAPVAAQLRLTNRPVSFAMPLTAGTNYLVVTALSEGTDPPNTAEVEVSPCRNGRPSNFQWDMEAGDLRHVSIVRR